jgi:hypothetical protein
MLKKTKFIIHHSKGKKLHPNGKKILFDENEPGLPHDPAKISEIERVRNDHANKNMRAYKTLGIYLGENLTLNHHIEYLTNKLSRALFMINSSVAEPEPELEPEPQGAASFGQSRSRIQSRNAMRLRLRLRRLRLRQWY